METVLKKEFYQLALNIRARECLTQEHMAAALLMDKRSYADIERGVHKCGALTILLLLLYLEDEAPAFLRHLKADLKELADQEALLV